ncbi:isochorismatase family cysteine hydrolase [Sulfobacillus thermosulfidooxidans]|uniref:isochorismatase family cysteine hydrolase n=1 Tax=Sulfobacillus thermosulfidooxidans TaxID=28034 RepID=UPI0004279588|nr:isochorismatase family cysteine hydrolase [Sulfobacillus thermosulfidooxidans]
MLQLNNQRTAVMFIDMQNSIARHDQFQSTIEACQRLLTIARTHQVPVIFVHVRPYEHVKRSMRGESEVLLARPGSVPMDPKQYHIIDALPVLPEDHVVTKHVRSAFVGTELDHLLRALEVDTIVIGGIATNIGVESTVRVGADLGYNFVVAQDACAALSAEAHEASLKYSLPFFSRITTVDQLEFIGE